MIHAYVYFQLSNLEIANRRAFFHSTIKWLYIYIFRRNCLTKNMHIFSSKQIYMNAFCSLSNLVHHSVVESSYSKPSSFIFPLDYAPDFPKNFFVKISIIECNVIHLAFAFGRHLQSANHWGHLGDLEWDTWGDILCTAWRLWKFISY